MEESDFLQDLLECSVCLAGLTEQNKVLPCQHTFCVKCLAEILQTQNEIRCPECRILYKEITNLDELPSNILLIRLLEGLKQNMRIKNNRPFKTPNQTPMKQFGKLSLHQQPAPNLVQRQLMTSKSVLQQLSANVLPSNALIQQQQFVSSPRQLMAVTGLPATNGHSMVYGNVPQLPAQQTYSFQKQSNRRALLESTLAKQTEEASVSNSFQTVPKLVNTPTSSTGPTNSMASSSTNNLNAASISHHYQSASKPIMTNGRALRDHSTECGIWSIRKNDILFIKEQLNAYWYLAIFDGIQGVVPISFVELIPNSSVPMNNTSLAHSYSTLPSSINPIAVHQPLGNNVNNNVQNVNKQAAASSNTFQQVQSIGVQLPLPQHYFTQFTMCRALYDFRVADVNDKNCLTFKKNDLITLIRRVDENWLEGSLENNIGIFPITFVEFLPTIRPATRSTSQNSGSSSIQSTQLPTPPIYHRSNSNTSTGNSRMLNNISHSRSNSISIVNGNNVTSNVLSSNNSKQSSGHQCNSANLTNTMNDLITNQKLTSHHDSNLDTSNQLSNSSSSNSYNNLLDIKSNQSQQANLYIALYNYQPQKKDELQLKKNELYVVNEKYLDGWFKGTNVKTNATGLFPSNYLLPARNNSQSYQNVAANRRSFGNLSAAKSDSVDNLLGTNDFNNATNSQHLTKPKQLTSSIDTNLSDLNSSITKMALNAKSENYLSVGQQRSNGQCKSGSISKSVEQLNNDNSIFENFMDKKKDDSDNSSANNSPQWIQPKVAATRSASKQKSSQNSNLKTTSQLESPYSSFVLSNGDLSNELRIEITTNANNTTHVIKEVINTPIKKEEKRSALIKMFTGKRSSKIDKHKNFAACNPTFVDISPKN